MDDWQQLVHCIGVSTAVRDIAREIRDSGCCELLPMLEQSVGTLERNQPQQLPTEEEIVGKLAILPPYSTGVRFNGSVYLCWTGAAISYAMHPLHTRFLARDWLDYAGFLQLAPPTTELEELIRGVRFEGVQFLNGKALDASAGTNGSKQAPVPSHIIEEIIDAWDDARDRKIRKREFCKDNDLCIQYKVGLADLDKMLNTRRQDNLRVMKRTKKR